MGIPTASDHNESREGLLKHLHENSESCRERSARPRYK
jgi:hypothetical protein